MTFNVLRLPRELPIELAEFALDLFCIVSGGGAQSSELSAAAGSAKLALDIANGLRMSAGSAGGGEEVGANEREGTCSFEGAGAPHTLPLGPAKLNVGSCGAVRAEEVLPLGHALAADAVPNNGEP